MRRYGNSSGKSGVSAYEIEERSVTIRFVTGETYVYTYRKPGKSAVEQMKKLAAAGKGLSTFISQEVKNRFDRKLD